MPSKTVVSLCLAAAVAFAPRPAAAQQKVEARRSASADALVEIENPAGSVRVIGWDRGEVLVNGDLGAGASGLDFTGSGSRIRVGVDTERNPHGVSSALEVHVPAKSRLQIESFAGSITSGTCRRPLCSAASMALARMRSSLTRSATVWRVITGLSALTPISVAFCAI